jgi:hypothetical protein
MSTKITVNGVRYESVDAMPPDVRKTYDDMMARLPNLIGGMAADLPRVIRQKAGPLELTTSIQKRIVVDGKTYAGEAAMPPDVREKFQQMVRAAGTRRSETGEVGTTIQITRSGFGFGTTDDASLPASVQLARLSAPEPASSIPSPAAIEPSAIEWRARFAILIGIAVVALALWLLAQIHL